MADPLTDQRIERVIAALDAGLTVSLNEDHHTPGYFTTYSRYTLQAVGAGSYRKKDSEYISDAASVPFENAFYFDRDGLRRWLGTLSAKSLADACIELPDGKSELLAKHLLPGEELPAEAKARLP